MAMTEQEWLACSDPQPTLELLRGKASDRKLRLFAVACCRHVWTRLNDARLKSAIETSEKLADGMASKADLENAHRSASDALDAIQSEVSEQRWYYADNHAAEAVYEACRGTVSGESLNHIVTFTTESVVLATNADEAATRQRETGAKAIWVRDIFGNPFRPVTLHPAWRTSNVTALAQTIYDDRAFDRLPILADALEDAGCDNADILNHCRQPGEHVRGCWVVDLILGKS
jgi:hypothetical protein